MQRDAFVLPLRARVGGLPPPFSLMVHKSDGATLERLTTFDSLWDLNLSRSQIKLVEESAVSMSPRETEARTFRRRLNRPPQNGKSTEKSLRGGEQLYSSYKTPRSCKREN